jgi:hypothetical protein
MLGDVEILHGIPRPQRRDVQRIGAGEPAPRHPLAKTVQVLELSAGRCLEPSDLFRGEAVAIHDEQGSAQERG